MDTKKLIEEARKIAEQQKEQEVIQQFLEVLAAPPAASTTVTPQQFLDRVVAGVSKLAKLQVSAAGNTPVNLATMDASTDDKKLVSNGRVYEIANYEVGLVKVVDSAGAVKDLNTIDGKTAGGNYHLVTQHYVDSKDDAKANANLKVMGANDAKLDLSTMTGEDATKCLVTRQRANEIVDYFIGTSFNTNIQFVADDGTIVNVKVKGA